MILRFALGGTDHDGRPVHSARVLRWHKQEGDVVDPGDDLCDLRVEEVLAPENLWEIRREGWRTPGEIAGRVASYIHGEPVAMERFDTQNQLVRNLPDEDFVLRMTSAEAVVLRSVMARPGDRRRTGELLAIVSTDPGDHLPSDMAIERASTLRVVENLVPWHDLPSSPDSDVASS